MKNHQRFLPGIHFSYFRSRRGKSARRLLIEKAKLRQRSLSILSQQLEDLVPAAMLEQSDVSAFSRRRIYTKARTFWGFFSQILDADGGCREAVRRIQAGLSIEQKKMPSASTAAYCKARAKLDTETLRRILIRTTDALALCSKPSALNQRRVVVADGTGLSMPDTAENQDRWPQSRTQKPGCGFPYARLLALFDLSTGGHLSHALGNKHNAELPALRTQWDALKGGDILLGDGGFCSYFDMAQLQLREIDSVVALKRRKPVPADQATAILGPDDLLIQWDRPRWNNGNSYTAEALEQTPNALPLRQIKVTIKEPGFRTQSLHLVTTLTDPEAYPAQQLIELYRRRWQVELYFRDIKSTMGMDVLRCRKPGLVENEILMHLIVYNSLRWIMIKAQSRFSDSGARISFKASMQAIRQWEPMTIPQHMTAQQLLQQSANLLWAIAAATVPDRPGRSEPRCLKKRPKQFQRMTHPRAIMKVVPHRGKRAKKAA